MRWPRELGLPVLVHFQEVEHFPGEGLWGTGFKRFEAMLRKYPKTRFIGHADAFWANVDAKYANEAAYPTGPITRGGITDKLLGDYANLFGDLSANSGNNAMSRDAVVHARFPEAPPGQAGLRQRLLVRRRKGHRHVAVEQPGGRATVRQMRRARDADPAARVDLARGVPQAHLDKRPHALQDRWLAERRGTAPHRPPGDALPAAALEAQRGQPLLERGRALAVLGRDRRACSARKMRQVSPTSGLNSFSGTQQRGVRRVQLDARRALARPGPRPPRGRGAPPTAFGRPPGAPRLAALSIGAAA